MQLSFVDLRHKTQDIQAALDRSEEITLTYRGKAKAKIVPIRTKSKKKIEDHPAFGMWKDDPRPVEEIVRHLRRNRYHDLFQQREEE